MSSRPSASLVDLLERPDIHSASRLVSSPRSVRTIAWVVGALLPSLFLLLLFMPWQQAALGTGRVIALSMEQRQQTIDASISGVIQRWHVREGQRVQEGELLVTLRDNDPLRLDRLSQTQAMGSSVIERLTDQVQSYESKLQSLRAARDLKVAEARAKVLSLERKKVGLAAAAEIEGLQAVRLNTLAEEGISSQRKAELGQLKAAKTAAQLNAMQAEITAARHAQQKASAAGDAKVAATEAELDAARAKLTTQQQKQLSLDTKLGRQQAQTLRAPRDGVVLQLLGGPGGTQVKKGDTLVTFVPETKERAVELWVDGNDMPLIREGEQVRLLFEGWPAIQVVGFPGADAGTYAGRVAFVNATDDGKGNFRVVVTPDPKAHVWPDAARLRQGVRTKGYVLLGRVSLGYELWRRINGFPSLPPVNKGSKPLLPSSKKPKTPASLK